MIWRRVRVSPKLTPIVVPKLRLSFYFASWWLPSTIFLALVAALTVLLRLVNPLADPVVDTFLAAAGSAFIGVIGAAVWNLAQKKWTRGLLQLLLAVVCAAGAFAAGVFLMLTMPR